MHINTRYRRKVIQGLAKAIDDEASHLRLYYRLGRGCGVLGGLLFGLALFSSLRLDASGGTWLVALGALGGLLIGLSVHLGTSVQQWPVIREFVNVQAIQDAVRSDEL